MNDSRTPRWLTAGVCAAGLLLGGLLVVGCAPDSEPVKPAAPPTQGATAKKTPLARNVFLEVDPQTHQRRIIVPATVVLREGQLEGLLTRGRAKAYEYILAADCDARDIHKALIAAGATQGKPAFFGEDGKYAPASGSTVRVSVRYKKDGKTVTHPAQQWIQSAVNQRALEHDWVFAGSRLIPDPEDATKAPFYEANVGDVVCVINQPSAMLDLPVKNPNTDPELRVYQAYTERIPPLNTRVEVILEPVADRPQADDKTAPDAKE